MDNRNKQDINLDDIDILPDPTPEPELETDNPEPTPTPQKDQEIPGFDDEEEIEDDSEEEPTPKEPEEPIEKKLTDVSREATALHFKNKKLVDTIEEASKMPEPTTEELKAYAKTQGADYDELDEFSQNILKKTYLNEKRLEKIQSVTEESKAIDAWAKKVDTFIEESVDAGKYPSLASLGKEFRRFAMKETRRGVDLNDLVASFLYSADRVIPKNKKSLLLGGGNGSAVPPKPTGLSEDDVARIREKDPKEYRRLIKAGKINIEL